MTIRSSVFLLTAVLFVAPLASYAQRKADKEALQQLKDDISYLASDKLEGRRTGTPGEQMAAAYIEKRYQQLNVPPYKNTYYHPFHFTYGKQISPDTRININGVNMAIGEDGFPMPFSANKKIESDILPDIQEQENAWILPLYSKESEAKNPHFDWEKAAFDKSREAAKQGATAVVFYDNYSSEYAPVFNERTDYEVIDIPVAFISNAAYNRAIVDRKTGGSGITIKLNINIEKRKRSGNNLAAYIDNNAKLTVVLGAHYDHLGYGEDHNSRHANAEEAHLIHGGADDNASGTAALLEMAKRIKKNRRLHNYNYLFVNFSGEELGLYGSKAFVNEQGLDSNSIAYMINMDMVGRLNDSTHALTIGGVGTAPEWGQVVAMAGDDFKVAIDSSGTGPSDHTSFYNAGIPVLFLFTGLHKDYHKPSDKADLINYPGELQVIKYVDYIVRKMDKKKIKPHYTLTKQKAVKRTRFKVTLGIMPDYTFDGGGVRVDGVSDNRPAIKAGIQTGDVITRLGEHKIQGMQSYMEALGKLSPGDKTDVEVLREGKQVVMPIEF